MPAALDRLRARYRLVVLSNGDPDMLEAAKPYHGVAFERAISVMLEEFAPELRFDAFAFKPYALDAHARIT